MAHSFFFRVYMAIEIERKFLVKDSSYKSLSTTHCLISQGYIHSGNGKSVRIRIKGEKGYITIKGSSVEHGLARYEWEKEIPLSEAQELMLLCDSGCIEKIRYIVPNGLTTVEVDEFRGDNEGLVIAEIELPSTNAPYDKPDFLGEEVTGKAQYYNSYLSKHPYKYWGKTEK